ncbi:S-adenosyl-L-methionine-dependent methyltransferase [Mycena pura]|uniref:S-adenosyl-L-methionine-dependent methyltransferase n=1 Tax=Mycena pura TaxID=153505 RepID=A0AAD6UQQ3_9AGAR|nr:S-adenosyl-L-methionine-dependent methyltransferase [Mycena pura]
MDSTGLQTLRRLASIINESLDTMENAYSHAGQAIPTLDAPFDAENPAEAVRQEPAVATAILNVMAASSQMSATVCSPAAAVLNASQAFHISSCLRAASELNVVEILREAGPQGCHVNEIAATSKADPALLARILRLLATHHIFSEVAPNVFANNRISSALDKGKPSSVLFEKPKERLVGTSGLAALVEFFSEDIFKSSAWLTDTILEPKEGVLPYNKAFETDQPLYYYMQRPENAYRLQRFGLGMQGSAAAEAPDTIFTGFDWNALPAGGVLVDVGGGNGFTAMTIAQKYPKLRVVVQDLEHAVEGAKGLWKKSFPSHIESKMVEFQAFDFHDPQPVKNADVFMLRYIAHNWNDVVFPKILQNLRDVAQPTTQLVIIEKILSLATAPGSEVANTPGAHGPQASAPLLPNWGIGQLYYSDLAVHTMLGGGERTLSGFIDVLGKGNWKLVRVHHCTGSQLSHIVAVPA